MGNSVLIVDDSIYIRSSIRRYLEENHYQIVGEAEKGEKAIDIALLMEPDIITLDNVLPDMMGFDVLKALKKAKVKAKIIMISAVGQQTVVNKGLQIGAVDYLVKPFTKEQLLEVVNRHSDSAKDLDE